MSIEIEAKFVVPDKDAYARVRALERLGRYSLFEARVQDVRDEYLDTPDRALLAAGYACRKRALPGAIVMTLKSVIAAPGVVHRREELEVTLPPSAPASISPSAWPGSAARNRALDLAGGKELQALFHLSQNRFIRDVADDDRRVAVASLDEVKLSVGGSSQQWWELELELAADGTEADLAAMSGWVRAVLGLSPSPASKFERALAVLRGP